MLFLLHKSLFVLRILVLKPKNSVTRKKNYRINRFMKKKNQSHKQILLKLISKTTNLLTKLHKNPCFTKKRSRNIFHHVSQRAAAGKDRLGQSQEGAPPRTDGIVVSTLASRPEVAGSVF